MITGEFMKITEVEVNLGSDDQPKQNTSEWGKSDQDEGSSGVDQWLHLKGKEQKPREVQELSGVTQQGCSTTSPWWSSQAHAWSRGGARW